MSVDEVAWQKWHKYVTNVVDLEQRKVIWNHDGRGKSTLDAFFADLGESGLGLHVAVLAEQTAGVRAALATVVDQRQMRHLRRYRAHQFLLQKG